MAVPQQKFREIIFLLLYSRDISRADEAAMIPLLMKELAVTKKTVHSAHEQMEQILKNIKKIDGMIAAASKSYDFERIQTVERNILRLAAFELFYSDAIPPKVAIAEAIRLSCKFASPESASFVNAVLDTLYKESLGESSNTDELAKAAKALAASEALAKKAAEESKEKKH